VNQDVGILRAPAWFLPFVFDRLAEGIRPMELGECVYWVTRRMGAPFDPTLLSPSPVGHFFTDDSPEDIVINVFALVDSHLRHNLCEFFLLLLAPRAGDADFTICDMIAITVPTV
jgi:hypothetical protein